MTTNEIANRLYELCKQGKFGIAQAELYAEDVTSTERNETVSGLEVVKEKTAQFQGLITALHSAYTHEPKVFGNHIFMEMGMNAIMTGIGEMNMVEMCQYEVKDGKIISEQFFY